MATEPKKHTLSDPAGWVDKYADYLFGYAFYRLQDTPIAEDLTQETFMAALASLNRYQGTATEKTWLTGILKHKIMDALRHKYRHASRSFETVSEGWTRESFDDQGNWQNKPRKWKDNPADNYEQQEFMEVLQQCLRGINPKQADAFRLRELDGVETKEICKVLQISTTNYWVILHRARLHIRGCVEKNWFAVAPEE